VIGYLDTSAVVPLLIAEPGSGRAASLARHAGELAEAQRLRGHDAVQLAAAR
jgi:predicted nucleic acid-binding protein